jgi:hypothetical protein
MGLLGLLKSSGNAFSSSVAADFISPFSISFVA